MKIPRNLPQFKDVPTLLLVSGEFEAKFYVGKNGEISQSDSFQLNPREEAKEKQAFVGKKGGMRSLSSVSHHGRYIEDLKAKFLRQLRDLTDDVSNREKIGSICLFAPDYAEKRIEKILSKEARDRITHSQEGHYLNETPLELLKMMQEKSEEMHSAAHVPISKEEKKIIRKPVTKPKKG